MENRTTLLIKDRKLGQSKNVRTDSSLFDSEVVVVQLHDKIIFRRAGIDDNKTYKFIKICNYYRSSIITDWEDGLYYADEEESNEDEIVIYYEQ